MHIHAEFPPPVVVPVIFVVMIVIVGPADYDIHVEIRVKLDLNTLGDGNRHLSYT